MSLDHSPTAVAQRNQAEATSQAAAQEEAKRKGQLNTANPYQSKDFTGYGPIEGTRWLKDQVQQQFAAMSLTSDNPGLYVRQKFDIDKKIDGFGQNLTLEDAGHVWENVFAPSFDGLKVKSVQDDYDARGKALLDQIYAPTQHGSTRPMWDQIPKNERIAAAAYAAVQALTGHGDRAIMALARPLTEVEQENVKREAEAQANEKLRRQGIVEEFNVLMGNKKFDVASLEQRQREGALADRQERSLDASQRRQDESFKQQQKLLDDRQLDANIKATHARWSTASNAAKGVAGRRKALADYESQMSELTGRPWKAPAEDQAFVEAETPQEKQIASRLLTMKQTRDEREKMFEPKLKLLVSRGDISEYNLKHILPHVDELRQGQIAESLLRASKMRFQRDHGGWVTGTGKQAKPATPQQAETAIRTALTEIDDQTNIVLNDVMTTPGFDRTTGSQDLADLDFVRSRVAAMLARGSSPAQVERAIRDDINMDGSAIEAQLPQLIALLSERRKNVAKLGQIAQTIEDSYDTGQPVKTNQAAPVDGMTKQGPDGKMYQRRGGQWYPVG